MKYDAKNNIPITHRCVKVGRQMAYYDVLALVD